MISKSTLAVTMALFAGTAALPASAASMDNDPNTGLWSYIYYGPIADLHKQGLPISASAMKYMNEHASAAPAKTKRAPVYLLEDRQGILNGTGNNPYQQNDDKQS
ncbi:MAG: hypothetical protein ACXWKC_18350, partial [Xanthobacteraceae bacterium]